MRETPCRQKRFPHSRWRIFATSLLFLLDKLARKGGAPVGLPDALTG
nr:MAG TPA: hypothetical protein [Caudoviricetes sp.]